MIVPLPDVLPDPSDLARPASAAIGRTHGATTFADLLAEQARTALMNRAVPKADVAEPAGREQRSAMQTGVAPAQGAGEAVHADAPLSVAKQGAVMQDRVERPRPKELASVDRPDQVPALPHPGDSQPPVGDHADAIEHPMPRDAAPDQARASSATQTAPPLWRAHQAAPPPVAPSPSCRLVDAPNAERAIDLAAVDQEASEQPPNTGIGSQPGTRIPLERARVFNEAGLLGRAVSAMTGPVPGPVAAASPPPQFASVQPAIADGVFRVAIQTMAPPPASTPTPAHPLNAPITRASAAIGQRAAHGIASETRPIEESPPIENRARARGARRSLPIAGASIAVVLHALDQGVRVVARLDRLAESERDALAEEIAAMLARHGYAPAGIDVIARPLRGQA